MSAPITLDARAEANLRQREGADPDRSAWVSASAGSGKTKLLVDRVLRLLLNDVPPDKILCLTYTRAAAAEMANRVADTLGKWASCSEADLGAEFAKLLDNPPSSAMRTRARRLFARVLDVPGGMKIMTIHAFCQSLLRRFPLEAGVAPQFDLIEERDAAQLLNEAMKAILGRAAAKPDSPVGRAVASVTARIGENEFGDLMKQLRAAQARLRRHLAREGSIEGAMIALRGRLGIEKSETEDAILLAACDDVAFDGENLRRAAAGLLAGGPNDVKAGEKLAAWLAGDVGHRRTTFDFYALAFLTKEGQLRKSLASKAAQKEMPEIVEIMAAAASAVAASRAKCIAVRLAVATEALLVLGKAVLDHYHARKTARAALDYDDLIERARALLEDVGAAWVHYKLDGGIDHILVDEAQDTSPQQWRIVQALTAEFFAGKGAERDQRTRTIFAVGDRKQSIFSFQGADPDSFEAMRDWFAARIREATDPMRIVPLAVSFRSVEAVLDAVDNVFSNPDAARGVVEADVAQLEHRATRVGQAGHVELWPLVTPREIGEPEPWAPPVERFAGDSPRERLARGTAAHIQQLIASGERLDSRARAIQPGDILVLVRTRNEFLAALVRELKDRGIAVAGVDRMNLAKQIAVMDLLVLAEFLLHADDDLSLATALRGPLVGLTDDELFELAWERPGSLWSNLTRRRDERPSFARAYAWLAGLLAVVDFLPPFELFQRALGRMPDAAPNQTGRRALIARLGLDAADPLDEFLSLALDYDRRHAPSLQGFLAWFAASETEVKRDLDQGTREQVRVMTVHGAKGLQAPIVYLPDTTSLPQDRERLLWFGEGGMAATPEGFLWAPRREDEDQIAAGLRTRLAASREAEYRRLLYVAMTRAEDRLYVGGWQDNDTRDIPANSWYRLIECGFSDSALPFDFDNRAVLKEEGWTGTGLRRSADRDPTKAEPDMIEKSRRVHVASPLPEWATRLPEPERAPVRPLAPSRPVSNDPPPRSPLALAGVDREAGFRRGRVVHRLLELLPSLPTARQREAGVALLAAHADAFDAAVRTSLLNEVLAILDAPELAHLFGPGSLAEVPLVGEIEQEDGSRLALAGQIDRLAVTDEEISIVDYKTLRPVPPSLEAVPAAYRRQMDAYRALVGAIWPGRTVRCFLLWTDGPVLMDMPALPRASDAD
ncbi:MAG: double-strand break repair helicase AddA [Rhodospirillaceae bacterium]|nr:double-strand break repair helicase AddA [Rhodospirillaceae bacterium]